MFARLFVHVTWWLFAWLFHMVQLGNGMVETSQTMSVHRSIYNCLYVCFSASLVFIVRLALCRGAAMASRAAPNLLSFGLSPPPVMA